MVCGDKMVVPKFEKFLTPVLKFFEDDEIHRNKDVADYIADYFELDENDMDEKTSQNGEFRYKDRTNWALSYLAHSPLLFKIFRGKYRITDEGKNVLNNDINIDENFLRGYESFRIFKGSENNEKSYSNNLNQRNRIFFGAPGTGKSYELDKQKDELLGEDKNNYERVTFHPDYSYANFVGIYKPISEDGHIFYSYVEGPFLRVLSKALKHPDEKFLLIIEEINRANVAAVFGDIFQLLDRDKKYRSEYPIDISKDMKDYFKKEKISHEQLPDCKLFIPDNMYIWATMNSADQGVFFMDTAFKRRWDFTYIDIDNNEDKIEVNEYKLNDEKSINWNCLRKSINTFLLDMGINEDKCLGPFFISDIIKYESEYPDKDFFYSFKNKVLMYLYEDASKSKRKELFEGFKEDKGNFTYSNICKNFDKEGIKIFHDEIEKNYNDYYDKFIYNSITDENEE